MKESKRQLQVSSLIKRSFSSVLQQEGTYIYGAQALVTVTRVNVTPDMGEARIYLSIYNVEDKQSILLMLEHNIQRLRQLLAQRLRKHVRRVPLIAIFQDDTLDEFDRINELFKKIETGDNEVL